MESFEKCTFCGDIEMQGDSIATFFDLQAVGTEITECYFCPMCKRWYERKIRINRRGATWQ